MTVRSRVRLAVAGAAALVATTFAVLSPASPAVAYFSGSLYLDVHVQSPATLVARGAAVDVPVEFICTSSQAYLSVSVTQRNGRDIASGTGSVTVGCTRQWDRTVVRVPATAGGSAFRKGTALAEAYISGCTATDCGSERDSATITIER